MKPWAKVKLPAALPMNADPHLTLTLSLTGLHRGHHWERRGNSSYRILTFAVSSPESVRGLRNSRMRNSVVIVLATSVAPLHAARTAVAAPLAKSTVPTIWASVVAVAAPPAFTGK